MSFVPADVANELMGQELHGVSSKSESRCDVGLCNANAQKREWLQEDRVCTDETAG